MANQHTKAKEERERIAAQKSEENARSRREWEAEAGACVVRQREVPAMFQALTISINELQTALESLSGSISGVLGPVERVQEQLPAPAASHLANGLAEVNARIEFLTRYVQAVDSAVEV